jgi:hypothetical protein
VIVSKKVQRVACPIAVEGFDVGMVWHERSHGDGGLRWLQAMVASVAGES